MEYEKYPAQMLEVAGDLRRAPAKFEIPAHVLEIKCCSSVLRIYSVHETTVGITFRVANKPLFISTGRDQLSQDLYNQL